MNADATPAPTAPASPGHDAANPHGTMLRGAGLARIQAMLDAGHRQPPIGELMKVSLVEVGPGHAVFEGRPDRSVYNPIGSVHGGYAATVLDSACGIAVQTTLAEGQRYTTLELKVAYHRGLNEHSGTVRGTGRVVTLGRRVAFAEATLTDEAGRLCATATSTLLVFDRPGPTADAARIAG